MKISFVIVLVIIGIGVGITAGWFIFKDKKSAMPTTPTTVVE